AGGGRCAIAAALLGLLLLARLVPVAPALGEELEISPGARASWNLRQDGTAGRATSWVDRWLDQPGMLGDWAGLRPALEGLGIVPSVIWVTDVQGNPVGGQRHGLREFDDLAIGLDVDLDRLLRRFFDAHGAKFYLGMSNRSATSLRDDHIGNVFNVSPA